MIWILKNCPKCKGDVYAEKAVSGWDVKCLQGGYTRERQAVLRREKSGAVLQGTGK